MARYTLIDPVTGQQTSLSEAELTRNLRISCILLRGDEHLGIITHRDLVSFSRWCADEALARSGREPDQRTVHALVLVDRWLEDERSLSNEELEAAAGASWAAWAAAAAGAAGAAADAAEAAARASWAAWAAAEAADAARAAAEAAEAAARASRAAWAAAEAARTASYEAQAQWLVEHLQSGK